jgi:hypothetical protein
MITQKDKRRVEVLFNPSEVTGTSRVLDLVYISGQTMSNPGKEKVFVNNQQLDL